MNTDAFFVVGRQHHVCQDYAIAGDGFVAVSDGCSSSPHTDFGSRLLCRMAALHGPGDALQRSAELLAPLALPAESLDATLLLARWDAGFQAVTTFIHGDGVVVARYRTGGWLCISSSFPSGAPLYPNYDRDPTRLSRYFAEYGGVHVLHYTSQGTERILDDRHEVIHTATDAHVSVFMAQSTLFDLVLVMSDGALSFRRPVGERGQTESVPLVEVVAEMLALKGFEGEFISRRAKRFLKGCMAKGWHHEDDFSVAGIWLGDTP